MTITTSPRATVLAAALALALVPAAAAAQQGQRASNPRADSLRTAQRLDAEGNHTAARAIFQKLIDNAPDEAARAAANRRMAMSYGYDGNCAKVIEHEERVIAYWRTQRAVEPQNAHYQEGEMANEAARVCHDAGFFDEAERYYRRGSELGNMEPAPRTHPKSLWDYRLAHAMARIEARRGNKPAAERYIVDARRALDSDPEMAEAQERYFPYLVGYVALYTGDLATAERELTKAVEALRNDPFQVVLLGMTYEKMGNAAKAKELYERAFEMSNGSNPPNVYSRRFTREKLGR
ncbi:MAG: tetratricopeptide repeat protein [Gemmatimonadaceae bacterium]|nr:tetratricopeptide repeat protein [Gemmatimonadaceae bacterium]